MKSGGRDAQNWTLLMPSSSAGELNIAAEYHAERTPQMMYVEDAFAA